MSQPLAAMFDVENVLNLSWAFHLVQDGDSRHTSDGKLAERLLTSLAAADEDALSERDRAYLFSVRATVTALGSSLTKLAEEERSALADAEAYKEGATAQIKDKHLQQFLTKVVSRVLMYGGIGFALLGTLNPAIQAHLPKHDDTGGFSLGIGAVGFVVFAAGSEVVRSKVLSAAERKVAAQYEWMRWQARRRYLQGKLSELKHHRDRVRHLWGTYANANSPETISLVAITSEELRAHEGEMRDRKKLTTTALRRALASINAWRRSKNGHEARLPTAAKQRG